MDYHKSTKLPIDYKNYILGQVQKSWIQTNGTITKITKQLENSFTIHYAYQIDRINYESQESVHNKEVDIINLVTKMNQKTPINIFYDPFDPHNSTLTKKSEGPSIMSFIVFMGVLMIIMYGAKTEEYSKPIFYLFLVVIFGLWIYSTCMLSNKKL
jgi:hypothetical protein